jgi:pimeloyl-ACP methyl ester carboxylesterase
MAPNSLPPDQWVDKSLPRDGYVCVDGIRLHYLDWGGCGEALLFLHGLADTAHAFDKIAPIFTDHFHVLGLTCRGHGQSDKPTSGYDTATLVEDILGFLDAMDIQHVILVGHSFAGNELTMFAGKYPERVTKLIYLDAAYDHSSEESIDEKLGPFMLPEPVYDNEAFDALKAWERKFMRAEPVESALRAHYMRRPDGRVEDVMPEQIFKALLTGARRLNPNYGKVKAPALCIYADDFWPEIITGENREKAKPIFAEVQAWRDASREQFRRGVPQARIVLMPDTAHKCFVHREIDIVQEMRAFLLDKS